jgi:hypothetical protein
MATWPDPLGMARRLEHFRRHIVGVQKGAPYHLTGVGRVVVAIERLTDHRAHAIGTDHEFGLDAGTIGENLDGMIRALLNSGQAVRQVNGAVIKPACESVQQVGAMKRVVRSAIPLRHLESIIELEKLTRLHVARVNSRRQVPDRGDLFADTDRLQCFDGLRTRVNGGADLTQRRSGLENFSLDPEGL